MAFERFTRTVLLLAAAAAALVAEPRRASACGACICYAQGTDPWVLPDFSPGTPLNLRIFLWLAPREPGTLRFSTSSGVEVPFTLSPAGVEGAYWLEPTELLAPSTDYQISLVQDQTPDGGTQLAAVFTTGTGEDHVPPEVGAVSYSSEYWGGALCGTSIGGEVRIASVVDGDTVGGPVLAQLDIETGQGPYRLFFPVYVWTSSQSADFGAGSDDCFGYRTFTTIEQGTNYPATLTVWDWSGNSTVVTGLNILPTQSAPGSCPVWGEPVDAGSAAVAADGGRLQARGGCSVQRGASPVELGASLGLLAALGWMRRGKRRQPRR
jgi:hypothetical protein